MPVAPRRIHAVDDIMSHVAYLDLAWEVEFSDEFEQWWDGLTAAEQKSVDFTVSLLQEAGPALKMPHSSGVETSCHKHMRELRIQHQGGGYCVVFVFGFWWWGVVVFGGGWGGGG